MAAKNKVLIEVDAKDSTAPTLRNLNNNLKKTAEHGKKVDKQFRMIRGGMGQMGHQVQDVAVMLQSGQNPLIILGQQGSQVASLFGPQGAIIGAFLAVGAAIGTSMLPAFFKASEALKSVEDRISGLVDEFDQLNPVLKDIALRNAATLMQDYEKQIEKATKKQDAYRNSTKMVNAQAAGLTDRIEEVNLKIQEQQDIIDVAKQGMTDLASKVDGTTDATEKLIESLTAEVEALGKSETEQVRLTDAYKEATVENKKLIDVARSKIDAHEAEVEAIKAEQKALDKAAKDDARRNAQLERAEAADKKRTESQLDGLKVSLMNRAELIQDAYIKEAEILQNARDHDLISATEHAALMGEIDNKRIESQKQLALTTASSLIGMTSSMVSTMQGMVDEGSAMGKAFFVISQAMAAADAIIKGYQTAAAVKLAYAELAAVTANPGLIAVGNAHAAMAVGMGFATAGMIAGQTLASFEGGGLTGPGVRSGGMDGKGGRLAMVHPNEKITDLHKGQGESKVVNVNFTIQANDTAGFDRLLNSRRGQIVNIINQAVNDRGRPSVA